VPRSIEAKEGLFAGRKRCVYNGAASGPGSVAKGELASALRKTGAAGPGLMRSPRQMDVNAVLTSR
jgi:hypothetical protein